MKMCAFVGVFHHDERIDSMAAGVFGLPQWIK